MKKNMLSQTPLRRLLITSILGFGPAAITAQAASLEVDFQATIASEQHPSYAGEAKFYHVSVNPANPGTGSFAATIVGTNTPAPAFVRSFDGPVVAYKFAGGVNNDIAAVAQSGGTSPGIIGAFTSTDTTFDGFGQQQAKLWTATDPGFDIKAAGSDPFNVAADTNATGGWRSLSDATGKIDVSAMTAGSVHVYYGAFSAKPSLSLVMRDTDGPEPDITIANAHLNNDTADRTEYYLAEIDFVNDLGYDEIEFVWNAGSANGRGLAVVVTGPAPADPDAPTLASADIVDNVSGGPILTVDPVTYTVTFNELMDPATIDVSDFEDGGTSGATINSVSAFGSVAIVNVTPGVAGTLQLQVKAGAVITDLAGNPLDTTSAITDDTVITVNADITAPTLTSIVDNVGGPTTIPAFSAVTYTVTFDEPINASTVNTSDFGNSGSASISVNSVSPTGNPAVINVVVTPTSGGDLTLEIVAGATIADLSGNPLETTVALPDDTTLTVTPDPIPTLVSIVDNQSGGPVFETQPFTYFVAFDQSINPATVNAADFENGGSPAFTVNAIAATDDPAVLAVHILPGGVGTITLQIAAGATIENVNGTAVDTTSALPDDTTITVNAGSGPARGTITFDGKASTNANSTTLSVTFNASASDKLVVIVTGENGNPNDLNGNSSSVTYDGVPLTKVVDRNPINSIPVDQTYNDIWYLDNPATSTGAIVATVNTRGSMTAFALSGTAPGVGQTAISPQASKSVVLSTSFADSIVIASHGMGGNGNTANVGAVNTLAPLIEETALFNGSSWDGHVTGTTKGTAIPASTATYSFTGGNLVGSHTIAAEFLAAVVPSGTPYGSWATTNAPSGTPDDDFDDDGVSNGVEFVLGGDKDTNDLDKLPAVATSGANMTFTFVRDQASAHASVSTVIEVGTDLSTWPDVFTVGADTGSSTAGVTVTDNANGTDTVILTVTRAPDTKKFARLKVGINP